MNIKKAYILPLQSINKSSKAIAHADSTTGIARKTIQGSCLPFIISLVLFLLIKSIAVSYTHLDVYKRQQFYLTVQRLPIYLFLHLM